MVIRESVIKFFFKSFRVMSDDGEVFKVPIKLILKQVAMARGLTSICSEIFSLFNTIALLDSRNKLFTKEERMEIYKSAINSTFEETIKNMINMMGVYEGSIFQPLIDTFNAVQVTAFCASTVIQRCIQYANLKIENIISIIMKNIPYTKTSVRACQIFKYFQEHASIPEPDEFKILMEIQKHLIKCEQANDEIAYETFLDFILKVPRENFLSAMTRSPAMKNGLVASLLNSFQKFSFPKTLQTICRVIKVKFEKSVKIKIFKKPLNFF